jgi:hypothetical protein
MVFFKQIFATILFFKIFEIGFDCIGMDRFFFSNEEIAIAILFYLFVFNVKKSFGETLFRGLMEKGEYFLHMHQRFSNEKYISLESKKENLERMKNISKTAPLDEYGGGTQEKRLFLKKKMRGNEINQFYDIQLAQILNLSGQNVENLSLLSESVKNIFMSEFLLKNNRNNF